MATPSIREALLDVYKRQVLPFIAVYGAGKTVETVLECTVNDYLTFIILLFGLFCVSGNITMEGDFAGSPRINVGLLALGTLLSSCIGTTGASMLMAVSYTHLDVYKRQGGKSYSDRFSDG